MSAPIRLVQYRTPEGVRHVGRVSEDGEQLRRVFLLDDAAEPLGRTRNVAEGAQGKVAGGAGYRILDRRHRGQSGCLLLHLSDS